MTSPRLLRIPVVCDCCRAEGETGEDPFAAFGALLDFEPVPRRNPRADGWDAEVQRAFIAALSLTGSDRAACRAVDKSTFGVTQLLAHAESEGFRAAREQALAMAAEERSRRLAEGVRAVASEEAGWRLREGPWAQAQTRRGRPPGQAAYVPPPPEPEPSEEEGVEPALEWLEGIVVKYLHKVSAERTCRLAGNVVEADFYLRQMTFIELALDLMGTGGFDVLMAFREGEHVLSDIAETPFSQMLGEARRAQWAELGEPPRPEHPPPHLLVDHGRFKTEPPEYIRGGQELSYEEQRQRLRERHRQAAAEQVKWERSQREAAGQRPEATPAREDDQRRRDSDAAERRTDGLGRPACGEEDER